MNKTLFISTLVCIFCMTASHILFDTNGDEPQPGPVAQRCFDKIMDIIAWGCVSPGFERWQINITNSETDLHRFCCYIYDLADCIRVAVGAPNHCTSEERGAVQEYIHQALAHIEKGECVKHTRKTEKCINRD